MNLVAHGSGLDELLFVLVVPVAYLLVTGGRKLLERRRARREAP